MSCGEVLPDILASGLDTVVFDLDGTLARSVWPDRTIGEPIPAGLALLRHIAEMGFRVEIWSSRREIDKPAVWDWVRRHQLPVDAVVCGRKRLAALYVDDRAFKPSYCEGSMSG